MLLFIYEAMLLQYYHNKYQCFGLLLKNNGFKKPFFKEGKGSWFRIYMTSFSAKVFSIQLLFTSCFLVGWEMLLAVFFCFEYKLFSIARCWFPKNLISYASPKLGFFKQQILHCWISDVEGNPKLFFYFASILVSDFIFISDISQIDFGHLKTQLLNSYLAHHYTHIVTTMLDALSSYELCEHLGVLFVYSKTQPICYIWLI